MASTVPRIFSSATVKHVARRPLKIDWPEASVILTSAAGPWQTAETILPARQNYSISVEEEETSDFQELTAFASLMLVSSFGRSMHGP